MSRSYKKNPIIKDHSKYDKQMANRRVRNYLKRSVFNFKYDIKNGHAYKKVYEQYDVCDWIFSETYQEYVLNAENEFKRCSNGEYKWKFQNNKYSYFKWYKKYKMK